MKRTSKRQMRMNFSPDDERRVAIDAIDPGSDAVTIDGMTCWLRVRRDAIRHAANPGSLRARVVSVPEAEGDGWLPKGHREEKDGILAWVRQRNRRPVCLELAGSRRQADIEGFAEFSRRHPVGSLVEAEVLWLRRDKIGLRLAPGIETRMSAGDYVDRLPGWTRGELWRLPIPDRLEVIVRRVWPERQNVTVSLHGYMQDPQYCNAAAGYRRQYGAREGMFRQLPWDRGRPETPEPLRPPPGMAMRRLQEMLDDMLAGASPEPAR